MSNDISPPKDTLPQEGHLHLHGAIDSVMFTSSHGIWAVTWSFIGLILTAIFQGIIVLYSGSIALLADTIHNLGDASTLIPLWVAFRLERKPPSKRFTYGYGRVEGLAGIIIVVVIFFSAIVAGYESILRLLHPRMISNLWAVIVASIIGFIGNEIVAQFRIKVGKEIGSAALIADGYHARVDGLTSLAVFFGALGVWFGYPLADPVVGILITIAILRIVWESRKLVLVRLLDGVDAEVVDEIRRAVYHMFGVEDVSEVRVRWSGHRLHAEVNIAVNPELTVEESHQIAVEVRHPLLHHLPYLANATIHIDPITASGEEYHHIPEHIHNNLPTHSH